MKKAVFLPLLLTCLCAGAKDLGVQGNTWPIVEQDIRQMMVESAARTDWSQTQEEVKRSAETYLDRLPKRRLPLAPRTQTYWMDPSIQLSSDIQAPVTQPNGTIVWQVIAAKGTRVNPLHQFRPVTGMFLFDGSDEAQVKLAQRVLAREPNRIVFVEAGSGNLNTSSETLARPVFHASDAMLSRFKVQYLPSFIYPGTGANADYVGVTSYAAPYKENEVLLSWPDLGFKPGPSAGKGASK